MTSSTPEPGSANDTTELFQLIREKNWKKVFKKVKKGADVQATLSSSRSTFPLHAVLAERDAPIEIIAAIWAVYEEAVTCKDDMGRLPIHMMLNCRLSHTQLAMAMHCKFPEGAQARDNNGTFPYSRLTHRTSHASHQVVIIVSMMPRR